MALLIFAPIYVTNICTKIFYQQRQDKDKNIKRTLLKSDPGNVLSLRHLIRMMRRHDLWTQVKPSASSAHHQCITSAS